MIILLDSYNRQPLMKFDDVGGCKRFLNSNFDAKLSDERVQNHINSNEALCGYLLIDKELLMVDYPKSYVLSVRHSGKLINDFLSALKNRGIQGMYIALEKRNDKYVALVEEFERPVDIAEYYQVSRAYVTKQLKKDVNERIIKGHLIKHVEMMPMVDFESLSYSDLLKYAREYNNDNSYIECLMDLDIDGGVFYV